MQFKSEKQRKAVFANMSRKSSNRRSKTIKRKRKNKKRIIISVCSETTTYPGQDMRWTEPFAGTRKLKSEENFYHFSRYSPDEIIFAPKETAFFDCKTDSYGHIYKLILPAGTIVDEYGGREETRVELTEDMTLEYVGRREYLGKGKFKFHPH